MIRLDLKSVNSTNTYAKEIAPTISENCVIISEEQTAGYGTKNKDWYSDKDSIICSFLIKNRTRAIPLTYSNDIGIITSKVINKICNVNTYVKKPNDIYLNGKKIGGILIETKYQREKLDYIIIGIGLNVNQNRMPKEISEIATSLYRETERKYQKEEIISGLIKEFEREE